MAHKPTREEAYQILITYNHSDSLIRHALAVEAVMTHFAKLFDEDEVMWGIIGLVHDLDYERYPEQHCQKVKDILTEHDWPESYIRAIQSHGWGICSDVQPRHIMEKVLYATDELTGLIAAAALVRPSKSILDMEIKSIKNKWKDKAFAAGVNREVIKTGAQDLGMDLDKLIAETLLAMQGVAAQIGLKGTIAD